ncbi:MAG: Hint domain-containing protein [Proteobacteria bacterium]|nr:Hint domain-containing protein [Pseudomonadota bacterium]
MSSEHIGQDGTGDDSGLSRAPGAERAGRRGRASRKQATQGSEQRATVGAEDGGLPAAAFVAAGVAVTAGGAVIARAHGRFQPDDAEGGEHGTQMASALPMAGGSRHPGAGVEDGDIRVAGAMGPTTGLPPGTFSDIQAAMATGPIAEAASAGAPGQATGVMLGPWPQIAFDQLGKDHGPLSLLGSYVFSILEAVFGPSAAERAAAQSSDDILRTASPTQPWDDLPDLGTESIWNWDDSSTNPANSDTGYAAGSAYFADPYGGTVSGSASAANVVFASGTWTMDPGASLIAEQSLVVGLSATASLVIGPDSMVTAEGAVIIGAGSGGNGTVIVTGGGVLQDTPSAGSGARTTAAGSQAGSGVPSAAPRQTTDGLASVMVVGASRSGTGTLNVTGSGSQVRLRMHGLAIGAAGGSGTVTVSQGGTLQAGAPDGALPVAIAVGGAGDGSLAATGAHSAVQTYGVVTIGGVHQGSLTVEDGADMSVDADVTGTAELIIGGSGGMDASAGGGTAVVATGGAIESTGAIVVGSADGSGTLNLGSGGTVTAATLAVGAGADSAGIVAVDDGGTLIVGTGLHGPATLALGLGAGASASFSVAAGGTVSVHGDVALGPYASISVADGGSFLVGATGAAAPGTVQIAVGFTVSGSGKIAAAAIRNDGQIIASGGTLTIGGAISGSGTLQIAAGATLDLQGVLGGAQTISFGDGGAQTLILGAPGDQVTNAITGLDTGDRIELTRLGIAGASITAPGTVTIQTSTGVIVLTNVSFASSGDTGFVTGVDATTGDGFIAITSGSPAVQQVATVIAAAEVAPDTLCFLPGTLIATPDGEVPVEALREGGLVRTLSGADRCIAWIGEGRVLATRGRRTAATPVIIRKGAFAPNLPHRDLRVTKGHSFLFAGPTGDVLIPVEFLVNHRSILWDDRAQEVQVFHVELETHDILIANGAAAESYRDDGNRWLFRNANSGWHLPPKPPCAPVLTGGPVVDAVWRRLLDRSGPRPGLPLTDDPDLHLLADGARIDPVRRTAEAAVFVLRSAASDLRIVSRAAAPQELGLARDPRVLGVALRRIEARRGRHLRMIGAADARLSVGFHGYEPADDLRWTDGDAALPADLLAGLGGPVEITLVLAGRTAYIDDGAAVRIA